MNCPQESVTSYVDAETPPDTNNMVVIVTYDRLICLRGPCTVIHVNNLTVSSERIEEERVRRSRVLDEAGMRLADAQSRYDRAKRDLEEFERAVQVIENLAGDSSDKQVSQTYQGLNGTDLVAQYAVRHRGQIVKLKDVISDAMLGGFEGTQNAISIAMAALAKSGEIERISRGQYRLARDFDRSMAKPPDLALGDAGVGPRSLSERVDAASESNSPHRIFDETTREAEVTDE